MMVKLKLKLRAFTFKDEVKGRYRHAKRYYGNDYEFSYKRIGDEFQVIGENICVDVFFAVIESDFSVRFRLFVYSYI